MTVDSLDQPYECVVIESKRLAEVQPQPHVFSSYYDDHREAVHFVNLRKDGSLVVPTPGDDDTNFAHLATFIKTASDKKKQDLWSTVGQAYKNSVGKRKIWLSTSGLGVYYLHVRLDSDPRYYQHGPYKMA